ncbi:MAG TPA: RDD family protein [Pyrinomonadaceae bacterium]|nr:RDD family protein [Pyrinomonadaceae bacterium]
MEERLFAAEESLVIETPERVPLEFALASIGNRFLAVALDHAIQYLVLFLLYWAIVSLSRGSVDGFLDSGESLAEMPKWAVALLIFGIFIVFSAYFILFEWLWNGQTPGKRLLKLRVIREDGRPLTIWEAVTRNLVRICDAIPGFVVPVYSLGLIAIFLSPRDQRLGDIFAGTVVIRERTDEAPTFADTFSKKVIDTAYSRVQKRFDINIDTSKLTEREIEVVEIFLRRRWDLTERQRTWMAWRIALPLMYKLKPNYDVTDFTYEGFLEELLHRFQSRRAFLN